MRDRIFYTICIGFILGVLLRSFVFFDIYLVVLLGVISLALFFFFSLISKANFGILFSVFILAFSLGIFRFSMVDVPNPVSLESRVGQKVFLFGEIIDEPTIGENNQKLLVFVSPRGTTSGSLEVGPLPDTKILVSTGLDENYKYGDEINFEGKLGKPENFVTDQGKVFDYVNYLRKDGILYIMKNPKIEIISRENGNRVKKVLFLMKEKFLEKINHQVPTPESLLLGGLILGERSTFSEELRKSFVDTGTIHIVALSGYNVMIVAEWFMKIFIFLPLNFATGAGILSILLFVLMTGASSTAVRAGTMAILALIARATGRSYDVARALMLAIVFMIIFNPFLLVYDVSFELSVLATFAVIFISPRLEKYFSWVPKSFKLRDLVSVTTATYIFVLPFILYQMGNLSIVALPANFLILPFIPPTMMFGFITGFLGIIWQMLAVPFGFISYLLLHYELFMVGFLSDLSFASITFPNFPFWLTLSIYAYFIYKLFGRNLKNFFS